MDNATTQTPPDATFLKRKEQAVIKDLDTAFIGYQRLVTQVNSVRNWTVTIMAASVGILLTKNTIAPNAVVATALVALFSFMLLELRERSSMSFNKRDVLNLQRVFMEGHDDSYNQSIRDYEFRDLRLSRLARHEKIKHLLRSAQNWQVLVWYIFWLCALLLARSLAAP